MRARTAPENRASSSGQSAAPPVLAARGCCTRLWRGVAKDLQRLEDGSPISQASKGGRMTGEQLVRMLEEEFSIKIAAASKSQWRKKKRISPTIFRNVLKMMRIQTLDGAIVPIAEYHCIDFYHGKNVNSLANRLNDKRLITQLKAQQGGIYA